MAAATRLRLRHCAAFRSLALALSCCFAGRGRAAEVLSKEDAQWLLLLQAAERSALPGWMEAHVQLGTEVAEAKANGGLDVMVYGDSIMEAFRGTSVGQDAREQYAANKAAWDAAFAGKRAGVFAIAGDQGVHLLWRLKNGEGPLGLNPKVVTMMIGTNDAAHLSNVYKNDPAMVGHIIGLVVQQCVRELQRQATDATIVVFGLLPLQPVMMGEPMREFDDIVAHANREMRQFVERQQAEGGGTRLRFKDCGPALLLEGGAVNYTLIPDGVHPAGPGGEVLLRCMREAMEL